MSVDPKEQARTFALQIFADQQSGKFVDEAARPLADKLEELAAENERLGADLTECSQKLRAEIDKRKAAEAAFAEKDKKIAALRGALEFYENPKVYEPHPHGPAFDGGRDISFVARNALARNAGGTDA